MCDVDNMVNRKFIESIDVDDYEILTDTGWEDIKSIHKTIQYEVWQIKTQNYQLKCADTHIVFKENFEQVFAKDLIPGDKIITESGLDKVISVQNLGFSDYMYDLELGENSNHRYYTGGILSHNTTTYTVFCLWYATLFPEKKILISANKLATAIEIMDRIRKAYECLPFWIKPGQITYNKSELVLENGSSIRAFSTSSSGARGSSAGTVIIDEMAFIPENIVEEFTSSVFPIVSSSKNSKIIVVSTPNGASGMFYNLWMKSQQKGPENLEGWRPFRIYWWEVPGRDEAWKQQQIKTSGIDGWRQEYECDFLTTSTKKLINEEITNQFRMQLSDLKTQGKAEGKTCRIMSEAEDKIFEFTMWHEFDKSRTYAASGDVAEGVGGDSSILYIWDITDLKNITMCAKFESNTISILEFAYVINKILAMYCQPWLIMERNGISGGVLETLKITYRYPSLVSEGKNGESGVYSHITVKGKACLWAREMLMASEFGFIFYDEALLDEFSTFVKKENKGVHLVYSALYPAHDDHIMSLIWLCWLLQSDIVEKYYSVCKTVKSTLGIIYAQTLMPLKGYTSEELKKVSNDPMYKEFLDFKAEVQTKVNRALEAEKHENTNSIFKFTNTPDIYFSDNSGPTWSDGNIQPTTSEFLNPNNMSSPFDINLGGGFF